MSAIQLIENMAMRQARSRATVFFYFFARFEYALKRSGFVAKSIDATADWNKFARQHPRLLTSNKTEQFKMAVAYLKTSPPKKQITENGHLAWADDSFSGRCDLERLLTLVRRIRNNLFHGGKFPGGLESDVCRDKALLDAGLIIMQACLDSDAAVRGLFVDQLDAVGMDPN